MRLDLAGCLHELGRQRAALAELDKVLDTDFAHAGALTRKGTILHALGDERGALECFKQVVTFPPAVATDAGLHRGRAHWFIMSSPALEPSAADIDAARADLDWVTDEDEIAHLLFALYNGCERNARYAEAWQYLRRANARVWHSVAVDAAALDRDFARVYRQVEACALERPLLDNAWRPVFIAGLPRSGTTLLESVLLEHPAVISRGESPRVREAHLEAFGVDIAGVEGVPPADALRRFASRLQKSLFAGAADGQVVLEKTPNNFIYAHLLARLFRGARVLHTVKQPLEACFSLYRQHFLMRGQHAYSYDLATTVLYYRWHRRIIDLLARRFPDAVLNIDYADMVSEGDAAWRRIFEFCGLDWDESYLGFQRSRRVVRTISAAQVRQGLTAEYRERATRYGDVLGELQRLLEMDMADLVKAAG